MTTRTANRRQADRDLILAHVTSETNAAGGVTWVRKEPWMNDSDVAVLIKAGRLERQVRKEYDHQRGHAANMFGGAGVMVRKRAYLRLKETSLG